MKWKVPKRCDKRVIRKFAFLPIKAKTSTNIEGYVYEKRWLCFVTLHQTFYEKWTNDYFID